MNFVSLSDFSGLHLLKCIFFTHLNFLLLVLFPFLVFLFVHSSIHVFYAVAHPNVIRSYKMHGSIRFKGLLDVVAQNVNRQPVSCSYSIVLYDVPCCIA